MKLVTIIVNVALYMFFIILVLVFHFSTSNPSLQCGGRVATNLDDTLDKQNQISIGKLTSFIY
jgi:uncharacterized membrane protein affecting hemolysin expression